MRTLRILSPRAPTACAGARAALITRRREAFADTYLRSLIDEAARLGLHTTDVVALLHATAAQATEGAAS